MGTDVMGSTPKELMQGPLTSQHHMKQMHNFFSSYDMEKEVNTVQPKEFVCEDIINYRKVSPTVSVPFKFTLNVRLLKSEETGNFYKVWQSVMTNERDLTEEEIQHAEASMLGVGAQAPQTQPILRDWLASAAGSTCFECEGDDSSMVKSDLLGCLEQLNAHCEVLSPWTIHGSVYFNEAPVHFYVLLCKPIGMSDASHVAAVSRSYGSAVDFCDFYTQVKQSYNALKHVPETISDGIFGLLDDESSCFLGQQQWVFDSFDQGPAEHFESSAQEESFTPVDQSEEFMEAYVQTIDSGAHPATRFQVALSIAQLCCEPHQRQLFLGVEGGGVAALQVMLQDSDAEIQRCAVAILLQLMQDEELATHEAVLTMRAEFSSAVREQACNASHPEIMRLASELLPFMTRT